MDREDRNQAGKNSDNERKVKGFILTYSWLHRAKGNLELWVVTRWDINFCIRSSPLRGGRSRHSRDKHRRKRKMGDVGRDREREEGEKGEGGETEHRGQRDQGRREKRWGTGRAETVRKR